jgi:hypothetical protein
MLKQLSETTVYTYADSMMSGDGITTKIRNLMAGPGHGTTVVTSDMLTDVLYNMRHKSFNFMAKFAVIELFEKGTIELVYNEQNRIPSAVPFFRRKLAHGGYVVVVNISNFSVMKPDGSIHMDALVLYTLMLSAAFSLNIDRNIDSVLGGVPQLYGSLTTNVISRMVNLDQIKRSKILFIFTKFFYMQVGVAETRASEKAASDIKYLDKFLLEQTDLAMPVDAYDNLENLIAALNNAFPEFDGLQLGTFFDRWLRSYGEMGAFALEYVPFFYTMIIALVCNCNSLINIKSIEKEASRQDKHLISSFNRLEHIVMNMVKK